MSDGTLCTWPKKTFCLPNRPAPQADPNRSKATHDNANKPASMHHGRAAGSFALWDNQDPKHRTRPLPVRKVRMVHAPGGWLLCLCAMQRATGTARMPRKACGQCSRQLFLKGRKLLAPERCAHPVLLFEGYATATSPATGYPVAVA